MKIYDTTLRDGTQSPDLNLSVKDKVEFALALDNFGVDYIELGWPGSNPKDMEAFKEISKHTLNHAKICAFGATRKKNISAHEDENLKVIYDSIKFLKDNKLEVIYDAEHFFDGFKENKVYALSCLKKAFDAGS